MIMARMLLPLLASALILWGCNDSKKESTEPTTTAPQNTVVPANTVGAGDTFVVEAQAAADAATLTAADLPADWTSAAAAPGDQADPASTPAALSGDCVELWRGINESDSLTPDGQARSATFSNPATGETVNANVAIFRDQSLASTGEDIADRAYATCTEQFEAAYVEQANADFASQGVSVTISSVDIVEFRNDQLVDFARTLVITLSYQVEGQTINATIATTFLRAGRVSGELSHVSLGEASTDIVTGLRNTFARRLEEADAKLPE